MNRYIEKGNYFFDTDTNEERWDFVRLLNQQYEKIKKLERQLTEQNNINKKLNAENQKLFETLFVENQKAIEELKNISENYYMFENGENEVIAEPTNGISLIDYIERRIKELKGEKSE